jgi:hypothetical protein
MNKILLIFGFSVLMVFNACEKTEKVEDFPKHDSKLVVNSFFRPDTPFVFKLSKSLSPLDNAPFRIMNSPSAYIRVFEGNSLFDSFRVNPDGVFTGNISRIPKRNVNYRFECFYPGFGIVRGEDYLPDSFRFTKIKGFNTVRNSADNPWDSGKSISHTSQLDFDLDAANLSGDYIYIEFSLGVRDSMFGWYYETYILPEEISGKYSTETIVNKIFISNGGQKISDLRLRWDMDKYYRTGKVRNDYRLTIYSCSKNTYEYLRRSALQFENMDDPFAQPTPVSNNIINGFGIFGGFNRQVLKISF